MDTADARARRLLLLRASIKLLLAVGLAFLLVPFLGSIPWPSSALPADATLLDAGSFRPGSTRTVSLRDGSAVLVTRSAPELAEQLRDTPATRLWFPSAPGLADQDWFVLRAQTALDEPVQPLPAAGAWPGGFGAASGAAWDVAGRALKPWPGHPTDARLKVQNLPPMPWREVDGQLVLTPLPAPPPPP